MSQGGTAEAAEKRLPAALAGLQGGTVMRFVVDDALTLVLQGGGREASVRIDGRGRLSRGGQAHAFSPDQDPGAAGPVLRLLHERIRDVRLADDGTLTLVFGEGSELALLPEDHHIAWAVACGAASAACIAEGKVVWE